MGNTILPLNANRLNNIACFESNHPKSLLVLAMNEFLNILNLINEDVTSRHVIIELDSQYLHQIL